MKNPSLADFSPRYLEEMINGLNIALNRYTENKYSNSFIDSVRTIKFYWWKLIEDLIWQGNELVQRNEITLNICSGWLTTVYEIVDLSKKRRKPKHYRVLYSRLHLLRNILTKEVKR